MTSWSNGFSRFGSESEVAAAYGIILQNSHFISRTILGCYKWWPGAKPRILLAESLKSDPVKLRSTFYEELGHHLTATEHDRQKPFTRFCMANRDLSDQPVEKQALRWAAQHLISPIEIRWFISDGGGTLDEFARRFRVTEELALERFNALQAANPSLFEYLVKVIEREDGVKPEGLKVASLALGKTQQPLLLPKGEEQKGKPTPVEPTSEVLQFGLLEVGSEKLPIPIRIKRRFTSSSSYPNRYRLLG